MKTSLQIKQIRPIRVEGEVAYITLTKGYTATIDAADVHIVHGVNWYANVEVGKNGQVKRVYATTMIRLESGERKPLRMHRLILGVPDSVLVDHIDGDGLNNRRANMRPATRSENGCNQKLHPMNTSGVKGVTWHKRSRKWLSTIKKHGKVYYLGMHDSIDSAASAYAKASIQIHKEFGRAERCENKHQPEQPK